MLHWCMDDSYGEKLKVNMEEEEKENGGMGRVGMNFFLASDKRSAGKTMRITGLGIQKTPI